MSIIILNNKISIIGLGKLGLPFALTYASTGFQVIGYDINHSLIQKLQSGASPISEPQTQDLLNKYKSNITFLIDPKKIIEENDISFIVVPTPSKKDGSFSSLYIEQALKAFLPYIKRKQKKHTFVITSTISPGTMEDRIKPLLEKGTQKKIGNDIGLCYSPELIALGSVVQNITHPDFLFIGESDKKTGDLVESIRKSVCINNPKIIRTNWINAELIKLSLNAYITTKISFANMIARIAESTPDADSTVILNAIGQDSRIGTKYLKGGLGFGGPCFPRDNLSLYSAIKKIGLDIKLPLNTDQFNRKQIEYVYKIVNKYHKKGKTIGILGLSYKPDTNVIEESQGVLLIQKLIDKKVSVVTFDPQIQQNTIKELEKVQISKTMEECVKLSEVVVITTQWSQFKEINWDKYKGKVIVDCWRMIDVSKYNRTKNRYVQLGKYISST